MKKRHSFRRRLFAGFLLASLLPLLLCSAMLLQIFRLRLDSQLEEESREQLDHVISSLDGLYRGFQQTALALQASPYVAPALSRGQRDSTTSVPVGRGWTRPCARRRDCGLPSPPCRW